MVLAEPERDAAGSDVRPGARSLCTPGAVCVLCTPGVVYVLSQLPHCARAARYGWVACKGVPKARFSEPCLSMCWETTGVCQGLRLPLRAFLLRRGGPLSSECACAVRFRFVVTLSHTCAVF